MGVLGELSCPRLRAYAFLSQSPSMGTSCRRQFGEDATVGMSLAKARAAPTFPPEPGRQSCTALCGGRLRSGEAEWEAARYPQGIVWSSQSAGSQRLFIVLPTVLVLHQPLSPGAAVFPPVSIPRAQSAVLGTRMLQLPVWYTPDSGTGIPLYIAQIRALDKKASLCW